MSVEMIEVTDVVPAPAQKIYEAWLDSRQHAEFTGDPAEIDPRVGGEYSTGGGYATGKTLELHPYARIVQSWRSADFPPDADESRLEVSLDEAEGVTKVSIFHSFIPEGQGEMYRQGWIDYYLEPLKAYFTEGERVAPAPQEPGT
jgi:uncharacterized protein YndB with AHSA1/START domain